MASLSKWRRRLRWARRALVLGSMVASASRLVAKRGGGASGRPPGGTGRPAPPGGNPSGPHLAAARAEPAGETVSEAVTATVVTLNQTRTTAPAEWADGGDGLTAPDGFPIKVNTRSGIYHEPGGRNYERTRADRWYRTAVAAERDGFRAPKPT